MDHRKSRNASSTIKLSEILNLLASLIGIFGFLTGISSLPLLITSNSENTIPNQVVWFGDAIPLSLSIPVLIITLLFIYGLYFMMLIRINRFLYRVRVISLSDSVYIHTPGDNFSISFFVILGAAIGVLVVRAFFDISKLDVIDFLTVLGIPIFLSLGFLYLLCDAARYAGAQQEAKQI